MPQLVVANAAQLRLIWSLGGSLYALNIMGVVANAVPITQAITNTIGTAIKSSFTSSALSASISTQVSLVNIGLRDIRTANTAEFLDSGAAVPGTLAGDLLPPQTALCVTLRTAQAGRSFRGRVYLCGFGEAVSGSTGAFTTLASPVNFITALKANLVTSGMDLGVLSRPRFAPLPPSAGFVTPVTSIVLRDSVWDTQRRRAVAGI